MSEHNIFEVKTVQKHFVTGDGWFKKGTTTKAVENVSLSVKAGETLAIVGESGSGKSTLARLLMGLHGATSGKVLFQNEAIDGFNKARKKQFCKKVQFIFQDPFSSLNPSMSVGALIAEPLKVHNIGNRQIRETRVKDLMRRVGLQPEHAGRFPHEFSGGQRQRIAIARALIVNPEVIIADEPVSALDVSVQAQIINLLQSLKTEFNLTLILISHDLAVVHHMADRIAVMYHGHLVEVGRRDQIFKTPVHPYTQMLLGAILSPVPQELSPALDVGAQKPGSASLPNQTPCVFYQRCRFAADKCAKQQPPLLPVSQFQFSACVRHGEINAKDTSLALPTPFSEDVKKRFAIFNQHSELQSLR